MESNEQTELMSKMQTHSQVESRMTASGEGKRRGWRDEQKGKRTHGHGQVWDLLGGGGYKGTKW